MKSGFVDKLIDRLDRLDPGSLQVHFLHLAKEKGLMETILHAVQEGIIVLDPEGCITYANQGAERLLGFRIEEASGLPIRRYLGEIEWERVLDLDEGEWSRLVGREIEINYPEHRFLDFYIVPLSMVEREREGAVLILRDITRERENEVQVLESERLHAITLLAAEVAHEIGNPLNALNIHLQLLDREVREMESETAEHLVELVDVARQEVTRLDQIIRQFLNALRPAPPTLESGRLDDVLQETLDFMRHEIEDRGIVVEVDRDEDLPTCRIDRNQIRQVFFNLLKNALQAMTAGGLLKIELTSTDRFVTVSFIDSGPGIPPEELGRIFEPYHTTKNEGSGLGLMIVQRVLRDHGGEIEIHSRPEQGLTITLFLPREDARVRLLRAHGVRDENLRSET